MIDFEEFKERYQKVPVKEYPNRVVETMPEPMVSVHVSTYQHADFIHDCMEGVLMQETDFPVEIIIGEDESDDGTREICKEYAEQYPEQIRLFLHRRENNIAIHGRPTGKFQQTYSRFKCRGKYIALCQGDDYWTDPIKLKQQVKVLKEKKNLVMSYHISTNRVIGNSRGVSKSDADGTINDEARTSTIVYKNEISEYPIEFFEALNSDKFIKSIIRGIGDEKRLEVLRPSVRRIHTGGVWGKIGDINRLYERFVSEMKIQKFLAKKHSEGSNKEELACATSDLILRCMKKKKYYVNKKSIMDIIRVSTKKGVFKKVAKKILNRLISKIVYHIRI